MPTPTLPRPLAVPMHFRLLLVLVLATLLLAPAMSRAAPLKVVASFSIIADLVNQIGGERVIVVSLIGPEEDAHGYQPRPSDARLIREADRIFANGLGFDSWVQRLAGAAGSEGRVVIVSSGITALERSDDHGQHQGHEHGTLDPHAWQDITNVRRYVANIATALGEADPAGADTYATNLARYDTKLRELDLAIRASLAEIPPSRRKVVTSHEAFGYLGQAYALQFIAARGVSASSEPSAAGIARLIRQLRIESAPVVFLENVNDPRVMERIGAESGARLGGTLYSDALSGPTGPASDYVSMMRHNLATLLAGLSPPN